MKFVKTAFSDLPTSGQAQSTLAHIFKVAIYLSFHLPIAEFHLGDSFE